MSRIRLTPLVSAATVGLGVAAYLARLWRAAPLRTPVPALAPVPAPVLVSAGSARAVRPTVRRIATRAVGASWPPASPRVLEPALAAQAPRVQWGGEAIKAGADLHSYSGPHSQDRIHSRGVPGSQFRGWWASG